MRLLNVHTFTFAEFHSAQIPKYVIASHRWCTGAETSFKDVQRRRNTQRPGFRKVIGFVEYVKTHVPGVEWLWIDTCCIDDRSSQEVTEAINSMFRWYSNAQVCLAWLADVEAVDGGDFTHSIWFTRGWTLQELLAPAVVIFLTREWRVIGHKGPHGRDGVAMPLDIGRPLNPSIAALTSIPEDILRDFKASEGLGVNDKLRWSVGRETSREEDSSYCLFGILGVVMLPIYGEGGERARTRLLNEISVDRDSGGGGGGGGGERHRLISRPSPGLFSQTVDPPANVNVVREACQMFQDSVTFPQMRDRRAHIQVAYQDTYHWALLSPTTADSRWDNLLAWLGARQPQSQIYWITAKPGAGKSSLVRFLEEELSVGERMQPWAEGSRIVQGQYYFWSSGNPLQKSLEGLLRTLLHQLASALPELPVRCVSLQRLSAARSIGASGSDWTALELRECLQKFISLTMPAVKFLFLIDGLDEIDGGNDAQDELVDFLQELTTYSNVKLVLSSRQWTVFQDAFLACPQLRLQDLNARDIETFVRGQFQSQPQYRQLLMHSREAERLVEEVIWKADGVFLWTRLVVKELIRGVRDGDSLPTLLQKLDAIPGDLGRYFNQILESIEPSHRREASIILQLALHDENEFITLNPLRLLDLVYIAEAGTDFALSANCETHVSLFGNTEAIVYQLDAAIRKLSSRCKGLLNCYLHPDYQLAIERCFANLATSDFPRIIDPSDPAKVPFAQVLHDRKDLAFGFDIDFMHRSLRDYLLTPDVQRFLHRHTDGPFDARNYLRNARLVEIRTMTHANLAAPVIVGLASYFISTLSIPQFRDDPRCARFAVKLKPAMPYVRAFTNNSEPWYINPSLQFWNAEKSNFLTLAIDFGLNSYIYQTLTPQVIHEKRGRPILDYVLRPHFSMTAPEPGGCRHSIGQQCPNPDLVGRLLSFGANPNEEFENSSIWSLFLADIEDHRAVIFEFSAASAAYISCLKIMVDGGACLPINGSSYFETLDYDSDGEAYYHDPVIGDFWVRWPALERKISHSVEYHPGSVDLEILESMRGIFGDRIDSVKASVIERTRCTTPRQAMRPTSPPQTQVHDTDHDIG